MKRCLSGMATVLVAVACPAYADLPRDSIADWVACMQANVPEGVYRQDVRLVTTEDIGTQTEMEGRLYVMREQRSDVDRVRAVFKLTAPENLAGASYLVRENEEDNKDGIYVYLPAVKRVRRVTGAFADGAMMGTSFSYSDFRLLQRIFTDAEVSLGEAGELDGHPVQQIQVKTRVVDISREDTLALWVDQSTCMSLKGEFRRQGTLHKQFVIDRGAIKRSGDGWWAEAISVRDEIDGRETTVTFSQREKVESPSAGLFEPRRFYQ